MYIISSQGSIQLHLPPPITATLSTLSQIICDVDLFIIHVYIY